MGVTRVRFLLELWRRSSIALPAAPPPQDKEKRTDRWTIPGPASPLKADPSRHPPNWPG